VVVPASIAANCRNNSVPTIQNLSGTNLLSGTVSLDVGGNLFNLQSDAGLLILSGANQYVGSLTGGRTYAFSGAGDFLVSGPILDSANGAPIALSKTGPGTLTLSAANTYTNTTSVSAGTLRVNGRTAAGPITVGPGASLGGSGVVGGLVSLQPGSFLAPGDSVGRLTFNSSLVLAGTTLLELDRALGTNDQIACSSTLTYGGKLVVTRLAGTLQAGDTFTLFTAALINGSFSSLELPDPGTGLAWKTDSLNTGVLSVVAVPQPVIAGVAYQGASGFRLAGTGMAGQSYALEAATNLAPPVAWAFITNTTADGTGAFTLWDLSTTNPPQRYFRVVAP
jgi:fibronectin-binding autotransporter adhesin